MDESPTASSSNSARRLLSTSYKSFNPIDIGDRYVHFLLENEATCEKLMGCVLSDHLNENKNRDNQNVNSIEVDAFQLISLDPVLGNLTLRYPDTLLGLLEDSTVHARRVLRRRMEVSLLQTEHETTNEDLTQSNKQRLLSALTNTQYDPRPLRARLVHLPPHHACCKPSLSSLASRDVGTVVQIHGTCVRSSPVRMMETSRRYRCLLRECCAEFEVTADFGTTNNALFPPVVCPAYNEGNYCTGTSFEVVQNGSSRCDYQEIKVQESAGSLHRVGSVPRSLLIKLTDDLVDKCHPGDEVVVVGSLHAEWQSGCASSSNKLGNNLEIMVGMSMQAHSVRVVNIDEEVMSGGGDGGSLDMGNFSFGTTSGNLRERFRREFDAFWSQEVARKHPIATRDYIVRAVCPKLYGMHAVKLGMLLALIGGASVTTSENQFDDFREEKEIGYKERSNPESTDDVPMAFEIGGDVNIDSDGDLESRSRRKEVDGKSQNDSSTKHSGKAVRSRRRTQSHILLIGDPGTGKSQFLRFAAALSPRSVLTTGTGSSTAGLTCAAIKDSGNEFSLEAGALALADRGVCCIDEFGCMSKEDRTSIHEAMEQQTISVAKAGIVCKLNARATVVAVMNPNGGIYDNTLSVEANSRLGSALLSRFDLIFIMMDQASAERDKKISQFLLQQSIAPGSGYERSIEIEKNLNDGDTNGHWSMEKLRAYIAIVRDKFRPTLSPEASELLQKHYKLCRQSQSKCSNALPVTVRFLESLIRLSQAHARLMYRNEVTQDDAVAVILLMDCTATAYQNSRGDYNTRDDFIFINPIDTTFSPFHAADPDFYAQKENLLTRYDENVQDFNGCFQQKISDQKDQFGRIMSQYTTTQQDLTQRQMTTPSSGDLHEVKNAMTMIQQQDISPHTLHMNDSSQQMPTMNNYTPQTQATDNQFIPDNVRSSIYPPRSQRDSSNKKLRRSAD